MNTRQLAASSEPVELAIRITPPGLVSTHNFPPRADGNPAVPPSSTGSVTQRNPALAGQQSPQHLPHGSGAH
jgi:hypothetical protein